MCDNVAPVRDGGVLLTPGTSVSGRPPDLGEQA
jgi:hypothetical protein